MSGLDDLLAEGQRQFTICNACRYCEGYCAVFPAMEERIDFTTGDLGYLANICHDCRACYQACMYTEPHELRINIPSLLATAREETYTHFSRPRPLAALLDRGPLALSLLALLSTVVVFSIYQLVGDPPGMFDTAASDTSDGSGVFYEVVPHFIMASTAIVLTLLGGTVAALGFVNFLLASGSDLRRSLHPATWLRALNEAARLRWLDGGGAGCFFPESDAPSERRRRAHHFVAYGFLLCFAATCSAAFQELILGIDSPFPLLSVPVLLGTIGGIALVIGCFALMVLNTQRDRRLDGRRTPTRDTAFLISLLLVSLTGLLVLGMQKLTGIVPIFLLIHLGTLVAFYVTAPYGKFVHWVYHLAAILRNVEEREVVRT